MLAANFKGHGRGVDADADIDFPKLVKAEVVIGSERAIDEAREKEAASRREACAAIGIRFAYLPLDLPVERIDDDYVGFIAFDILSRD